jgi:hypothetical protein
MEILVEILIYLYLIYISFNLTIFNCLFLFYYLTIGTGKTTVARLYGEFLKDIGVLPKECLFKETTGSKLISDGVPGLTQLLDELKQVKGGIIFVDEAYQLSPQEDSEGRKILNFLLVHAERLKGEYGNLVWVFAGMFFIK